MDLGLSKLFTQYGVFSILLSVFLLSIPLNEAVAAFPEAPTNVQASDDTFPDKITINWTAPNGGDQIGYRLYRSTQNVVCPASPIATEGQIGAGATSYDDTTAAVGIVYYYSLRAVYNVQGSGVVIGNCSQTDAGRIQEPPAPNPPVVSASDGSFEDKVEVSFQHPSTGPEVSAFNIYRSTNPIALCGLVNDDPDPLSQQLATNLAKGTSPQLFDDTEVVPGTTYYYSMQSVGTAPTSKSSTCSNIDPGFARVGAPKNIQASDGTFEDKVLVTWDAPDAGGVITGYDLYRSETPQSCVNLLEADLPADPRSFDDTSAVPGVIYHYSFKTQSPTGESVCSPIDPGHRRIAAPINVSATDGAFPNKVNVTWQPSPTGGNVQGYTLYRSLTPEECVTPIAENLSSATTLYVDNDVIPGTIYYYSVKGLSSTGPSVCSNVDPGHAVTICSDGLDNDGDGKVDFPADPGCTSIEDQDETDPPICSDGLDNDGDGKVDFPADPGCNSPQDNSEEDLPVCSDGIDNDGDGIADFNGGDPGCTSADDDDEHDENLVCDNGLDDDQDGIADFKAGGLGDPGCDAPADPSEDDETLPLRSPAFVKFNTFLGQQSFAELINQGTKEKDVVLTIYNLRGEPMIQRTTLVPPGSQVDIDINSLVKFACDVLNQGCDGFEDLSATQGTPNGLGRPDGVVDTYGLVSFEFDDGDPTERLLGRISFYRPNVDGSYSFAFAREFRNPSTGATYAVSNTYDPRGQGFLVPNWAEVIAFGKRDDAGNLDFSPQKFKINIFDQEGVLKDSRDIILPGLGEFDVQAGHEFVNSEGKVIESVYLVEVLPEDPNAEYFLSVSRYSSNSPPAVSPETYNFAFTLEGANGTGETLYAPICNQIEGVEGLKEQPFVADWFELACVSDEQCAALVSFRAASGDLVAEQQQLFAPKSQFHFNASGVLPANTCGTAEVKILAGSIMGQSMYYLQGTDNQLQTAFASPARPKGRSLQVGSINTFLNMQDVFTVFSTDASTATAEFLIRSFSGGSFPGVFDLGQGASSSIGVSSTGGLQFPANSYGALQISTESEGAVLAEVRRVRLKTDGTVDYVMPTLVK